MQPKKAVNFVSVHKGVDDKTETSVLGVIGRGVCDILAFLSFSRRQTVHRRSQRGRRSTNQGTSRRITLNTNPSGCRTTQ